MNGYKKLGIRKLDGIVISHFHDENLGGILSVFKKLDVQKVWDPGGEYDSSLFREYLEALKAKKIQRKALRAEDTIDWGNELFIEVLNPPKFQPSFFSQNDRSVVLLLKYGLVSGLFLGDIEKNGIEEVLRFGNDLSAGFIKIPNHGSISSLDYRLFQFSLPSTAIISPEKECGFGNPDPKLLSYLSSKSIKVFRTDESGTIKIRIFGNNQQDFEINVDQR
ncbi:MAG: MBL fold metallo-hydrolase [Candidatus Riflebacteria bacterium]|nr:MBL fold metallo-hydrolase [Candidatus Riflebacteria bacterium]